ncbi:MAG: hypothetical protein MUF30_07160 [Burkholderiales bacterium]|nr:hypothetical protein [Burkholderiales bacterium]
MAAWLGVTLLVAGLPPLAVAQTPAAPAAAANAAPGDAASAAKPATGIGRLFFTREQRAQLDVNRRLAVLNASRPKPPPTAQPTAPPRPVVEVPRTPPDVTLNGVVTRSDGRNTVWVNATPLTGSLSTRDVRARTVEADGVEVALPSGGKSIRIKVGQTLDGATGRVEDAHRRRASGPAARPAVDPASPAAAPVDATPRDAAAPDGPAPRRRARRAEQRRLDDASDPPPPPRDAS